MIQTVKMQGFLLFFTVWFYRNPYVFEAQLYFENSLILIQFTNQTFCTIKYCKLENLQKY
jgi:hypothetical protein